MTKLPIPCFKCKRPLSEHTAVLGVPSQLKCPEVPESPESPKNKGGNKPQSECCIRCEAYEIVPNEYKKKVCANSDCSCHQPQTLPSPSDEEMIGHYKQENPLREGWEREFERKYVSGELKIDMAGSAVPLKEIKAFIRQQIEQARKAEQDRIIGVVHEVIEKLQGDGQSFTKGMINEGE